MMRSLISMICLTLFLGAGKTANADDKPIAGIGPVDKIVKQGTALQAKARKLAVAKAKEARAAVIGAKDTVTMRADEARVRTMDAVAANGRSSPSSARSGRAASTSAVSPANSSVAAPAPIAGGAHAAGSVPSGRRAGPAVEVTAYSVATFSRNVADGTKNRVPVTARLKSSSRS